MTYAQFVAAVKRLAFPKGEARNLVDVHTEYIRDGLSSVQQYVPCFRAKNIEVYPQCSSLFKCGISIFDTPNGYLRIKKVYTTDKETRCQPVDYTPVDITTLERYANHYNMEYGTPTAPEQHGVAVLPLGYLYADPSTNSEVGRAVRGWYAIKDGDLYVWPFTESYEDLIVEWEGVKDEYESDDTVFTDEIRVQNTVRKYLRSQIASEITCNEEDRVKFKREFDDAVAQLIWECRQQTMTRNTEIAEETLPQSVLPIALPVATVADPADDETAPQVWAVIGDFGDPSSTPAYDVAELVKSWSPAFIVTTGDNAYDASNNIDTGVGAYYRSFIYPYLGSQPLWDGETDATENKFWPCIGNHDINTDGGAAYKAYFTLPNNERYYRKLIGNVELFIVNTGINSAGTRTEPDGNNPVSAQAEWLSASLANSTAPWKIVVFHHPAYSNTTQDYSALPELQWDFKGMGADLVLNGHAHHYERLSVDDLPYVVCGASGHSPLVGFVGTDNSLLQYSADYGACKVTTNCSSLVLEFINRAGTVIDTLTLTK